MAKMSKPRDQAPLAIAAELVTIIVNCAAVGVAASETARTFAPRLKQIMGASPGVPVRRPNR
jgi:hypothetical protein